MSLISCTFWHGRYRRCITLSHPYRVVEAKTWWYLHFALLEIIFRKQTVIFTARRYGSGVYAVVVSRVSVCPSVRPPSVTIRYCVKTAKQNHANNNLLSHRGLHLIICLITRLLAILYDHVIMYVGLFGHSAVVFHVSMFFSCFICVLLTLCVVVFFQ